MTIVELASMFEKRSMGYWSRNLTKFFQNITLTVLFLLSTAELRSSSARAQDRDCSEIQCRARLYFHNCSKPDEGKKMISAMVKSVSADDCHTIITLDVENATAETLPPSIEISLGPCNFFQGEIGETIQVALWQPHSLDVKRYDLGCRDW